MERSSNPCSSPNTSDSSLLKEDSGGTGKISDSSFSLEEPNLDPTVYGDINTLNEMKQFEQSFEGGTGSKEDWSFTSPGGVLGCKTQLVAQKGEQWWNSDLRRCIVPEAIITEAKNSASTSTWTAFTLGFAHFAQAWTEENCGEFPQDFVEWCQRCAMIFVKLKEKGFPYTCLCASRFAFSLFSRISYGEDIKQVPIIKTIFYSFHRSHVPRKPYTYMLSHSLVFDYSNSRPCNANLSFFELTVKCILLYVDEKICSARAVNCLWERVRRTNESRDIFLLNTTHHTPLKTSGIRKLAKLGMTQVGIPQEFRPYTIKHAAISALILKGVREVLIAKRARLSPTAHTPTRSFLRVNLASDMAHALIAP
ncbi:uncharacterized protein MONOS_14975 [Monocercomonoides exilis]|uniref:uncharacterized protein n=1 Tax=Monocercomonoides exilis TaxID=2049356 RepID=UPI00355AC187|nr:hypothetical protein MONOS_14975 [Monocercomonoides exilis]|eukprot:MONOS_14975.1-p1 / transcript=MONOS_14975.1 / gene=MONOS_14975 / organism=Monocercomonoides_exilis_PA203 / gene_product=unspecified product / transcript_product=unspecified product / location=Mono_scaffold01118:12764-14005(-) / protein_length=366 / sequence_SO=supercontig / SO=protein_coding / is_pseudo=false